MYPKLMSSEGACICCSLGRLRSAEAEEECAGRGCSHERQVVVCLQTAAPHPVPTPSRPQRRVQCSNCAPLRAPKTNSTPLQSVDRLDRARCFSLNDVHSRRDHERAQGRRPANIKAMAATGRNGVSNADERTRRARSARPSADKCITFRINGRSADELRLAQVRMPTGAGAMMILQVHLPRDGPAHGRVGHPILSRADKFPFPKHTFLLL